MLIKNNGRSVEVFVKIIDIQRLEKSLSVIPNNDITIPPN